MAYLSAPKTARYSFSSLKPCYAQFCFYFGSRLRTSIASFAITYDNEIMHKNRLVVNGNRMAIIFVLCFVAFLIVGKVTKLREQKIEKEMLGDDEDE